MHAPTELVELIYSTVDDGDLWTDFLARFSKALGGCLAALHGQDLSRDQGQVAWAVNFDPSYQKAYAEYYASKNVHMTYDKSLIMQPGCVVTGDMVCPDREVLRSEYYQDFLRPQDLFHLTGGIVLREGSWTFNLSALRSRRQGPYATEEVALLTVLMPHLQRALQLHYRLRSTEAEAAATTGTLDHLPIGVLFANAEGRINVANRLGQAILDERDGLYLEGGRLRAADPEATGRLHALIRNAGQVVCDATAPPGGAMTLPRPSLKRPLAVLVAPLSVCRLPALPASAVAVLVTDPERMPETNRDLLRRLYGLTQAESRLAALLVTGERLEHAAGRLGVTRHTARTQLKSIFRKTQTRRQAELVRLVLSGPAVLPTP